MNIISNGWLRGQRYKTGISYQQLCTHSHFQKMMLLRWFIEAGTSGWKRVVSEEAIGTERCIVQHVSVDLEGWFKGKDDLSGYRKGLRSDLVVVENVLLRCWPRGSLTSFYRWTTLNLLFLPTVLNIGSWLFSVVILIGYFRCGRWLLCFLPLPLLSSVYNSVHLFRI